MNDRKWFLLVILMVLASVVAAEPKTDVPVSQPVLTVATTSPHTTTWPVKLTTIGGLYAWQDLIVATEIGGLQIVDIRADIGESVKKGQILAILNKATVEATLAQRRAETAQAQSALDQARSDAARARKAKGVLSEQQAEQYVIAQDRAQGALDAARAAQLNQEIQLAKTSIIAADDGVIASRSAILGAVVQVGSELFRLVRQGRIEWRAEVTAQQLNQVRIKQIVHVTLPSGKTINGRVRLIGPTLDPKTRKALVYVDLPTNSPARAGMFAHGDIIINTTNALTIPTSAIVLRDGFSYIFIVKPDNTVEQRKVDTGRIKADTIELLTPLEQNAAIVRTGGAFLEDGDKVRVVSIQADTAP